MYRKIVIGYDDGEQAGDALALGRDLALATDAEILVAGVYHFEPFFDTVGWGNTPPPPDTRPEREAAVLERIASAAPEAEGRAVGSPSPARGLRDLAEEVSADLVVVGSCHRGRAGRILAGSVGERLLHASPCAVAIAPLGFAVREDSGIDSVGVGYDGTPEADVALEAAKSLARAAGARLRILAVVRPEPAGYGKGMGVVPRGAVEEATRSFLEERVDRALGSVTEDVIADASVLRGDPAETLAEQDVNLLVVGSRRYGPIRTVLLGGVSLPLIRSAGSPVMVVPRGASGDGTSPEAGAEGAAA